MLQQKVLIKYLDQIKIVNGFQTEKQIASYKCRIIEAIGYLVQKDDLGIYLAQTINGDAFANVLFVPHKAVIEIFENENGYEINYIEAQGIGKQITLEKLNTLPTPPTVKICGFKVSETNDIVAIAQERNADGNYRTITLIPRKYVIE